MITKDISTYEVSSPFQLNPWKHHFSFILYKVSEITQAEELKKELLKIGDTLTDLYIGSLTISQIISEIKSELSRKQYLTLSEYTEWINETQKKYRTISISDGSFWVLRINKDKNKYIHIHPGKYSPFTIRVKSRTLKTAILFTVFSRQRRDDSIDISQINEIRLRYLNLPPVKSLSSSGGLGRMISLFKSTNK